MKSKPASPSATPSGACSTAITWAPASASRRPFRAVLDALGTAPERSVFIDDNPDNVARAAALGMTGIVYREREAFLRDLDATLGGVLAGA